MYLGGFILKKHISIGIIALFIVSAVSPMVIGYISVVSEQKTPDEEYAYNRFNEHYYPEGYLTGQYPLEGYADDVSSEEVIDYEDNFVTEKKHQKPQPVVTSGGPMDSPWPMKGHDIRHTGRSPYSTADNPGFEIWQFKTKDAADCSPAIDNDGTIYIGSTEFYALFPNGTLKWKYDFAGRVWVSAPAIDENGIVYVGTEWAMPNYLYAFYTTNGTLKWKYKTGDSILSSPAIGDDGTIYISDLNGYIHAVYPNGTRKWRYKTGSVVTSSPAIGDDGTIYCGSHDDYLYAFHPNNGTVKWAFKTGSWVHGSPTIGVDGTIYIGSDDGYLYALHPNYGTMKWWCKIGATWASPALDENGTLYVGVWEEKFYAIYPNNGTIKWTFKPGHRIWGSSAALSTDGILYFGTSDIAGSSPWAYDIIALNTDGTEKWRHFIKTSFSSPAIGEDGTVYIGSYRGLRAFGRGEVEAVADGPHYGLINEPIQFNGSAFYGYPPYSWHWDFGDDNTSNEQNPTHIYSYPNNFTVTLNVTDDSGNTSDDTTWIWIQESNTPPDKPSINGETVGKSGISYEYTFVTKDIDGAPIYYYIEWGDGKNTGWFGPFPSGEEIVRSHKWSEKGAYTVRVKAKDPYDAESEWAELTVYITELTIKIKNRFLFIIAEIKNTGDYSLSNITWELKAYPRYHSSGKVIYPENPLEGTISLLEAKQLKRVRTPVIGLQHIIVKLKVLDQGCMKKFWVFGPIIFPSPY